LKIFKNTSLVQIERLQIFEIGGGAVFLYLGVVRSFCFGLILSPLWHESPKSPLYFLSTFGKQNMIEDYTKLESWRNTGKEG
jgi:hypothetical protein